MERKDQKSSFSEFYNCKILGESRAQENQDPLRICHANSGDDKTREQGGVFFYILLAIILLAGLSYVISQNNRGNTNVLTDEQARLAATEIIEYGNTVAKAVQKLKLRGCGDTEISFENNVSSDNYSNPSSPVDNSCHVFNVVGGNTNYLESQDSWLVSSDEWGFKSGHAILNIGTTEDDLQLKLHNIKKEICLEINEQLNINNPSKDAPIDNTIGGDIIFTGTYAGAASARIIGDEAGNALESKMAGCRQEGSIYMFHQVLIAR